MPVESTLSDETVSDADIKFAPATPIAEQKVQLGKPGWDSAWDVVIEKSLPREWLTSKKVAQDVKPFCPRYASMPDADKRAYWAYFFQALAGAEAGLEPTITVQHSQPEVAITDPVTKRRARSEGLLQLAYMDSGRYDCDFDWEKDKKRSVKDPDKTILQPENNLLCGVKILNNQLIDRGKPLLTKKSYWSTLQPGTVSFKVCSRQMTNVPDTCRESQPLPRNEAKRKSKAAANVAKDSTRAAVNGAQ